MGGRLPTMPSDEDAEDGESSALLADDVYLGGLETTARAVREPLGDSDSAEDGGGDEGGDDGDDEDEEDDDDVLFGDLIMLNPFQPLPNITEEPTEGQAAPLTVVPPPELGFSLWRKLNKSIGRELRPVLLPATVNEPLSGLQRLAEELEYHGLLASAAAANVDPLERLARVAAFAVSPYSSSLRTHKPFNPLLGETFEYVSEEEDGLRFVSEQVSLSPPTAAWWAEGAGGAWRMWGEMGMRSKFWGQRIEVSFPGTVHLLFPDTGDHYVWNKASCWIHNIVLGNLWAEWHGPVTVHNLRTGDTASLRLPKCSKMPGRRGYVTGSVLDARGRVAYTLQGNYLDRIYAQPAPSDGCAGPEGKLLLYARHHRLRNAAEQYNFTAFTLELKRADDRTALPPTDSRLRPDLLALEEGNWEAATAAKVALLQRQQQWQRAALRPAWFARRPPASTNGGRDRWQFGGDYWAAREAAAWPHSVDIFGVLEHGAAAP